MRALPCPAVPGPTRCCWPRCRWSALLAPVLLADATLGALVPLMACSAAALYAAFVVGSAPKSRDAPGLRALGGLWLAVALLPALGTAWAQPRHGAALHASIVTLGSVVMAFIVLTLSSQRTERELRESRRRLRVLANIDMLTQVPNRRRFEELARRALQSDEAGSAALLLVDIDHFKQINDMLGHAAGDRALKLVSRCTLELLRSHDVAGRHGGDEFVMLLRRSSTQDAMQVAERLVSHLQQQAHAHALPRLTLELRHRADAPRREHRRHAAARRPGTVRSQAAGPLARRGCRRRPGATRVPQQPAAGPDLVLSSVRKVAALSVPGPGSSSSSCGRCCQRRR